MQTIETAPFAHLTPFVVAIAAKRVQAGAALTAEMLGECLAQAVEEDNARCMRLIRSDYEGSRRREEREGIVSALSESVYHSIPDNGQEKPWNHRWLACAAELGVAPDKLRPVEYMCWHPKTA